MFLAVQTFPRTIRKMVGPEHSEVFNSHAREWLTVLSNLAKMPLYLLHLSEAGLFVGHKGLSQTPLSFGVWYTSESCSSFCFCGNPLHGQIGRDPKFNTSKIKLPHSLLLFFSIFSTLAPPSTQSNTTLSPSSTYLCEKNFSALRAKKEKKNKAIQLMLNPVLL